MSAHKELIARLEGLEGPCRECDIAILKLAVNMEENHIVTCPPTGEKTHYVPHGGGRLKPIPNYTASIDASLTTVPKGWHWELGPERAEIAPERWEHYENANDDGGQYVVDSPTPIAICIAVLKAMEAQS